MGIRWGAVVLFTWAGMALGQESHLKHFTRVDDYIFAGSKPTREGDFQFLQSMGVKYILQADFLPGMKGREKELARKYGMEYFSVPMNASPVPPQEEHVNEALRIMKTHQPIYIHCVLGRDRTGLLVGLYEIYFKGLSKEAAYKLMQKEGFRKVFFLRGLQSYFDGHTAIPPSLKRLN